MPIIYIHGVATRDQEKPFSEIKQYLRRFVAPVISSAPENVLIDQAFWGDEGARFAWNGASRPRSLLLGQGADTKIDTVADRAELAATLHASFSQLPVSLPGTRPSGLISGHANTGADVVSAPLRLSALSANELSDLLASVMEGLIDDPAQRVTATLHADALAHDPAFLAELAAAVSSTAECELLSTRLREAFPTVGLVGMGGAGDWFQDVGNRVSEAMSRAVSIPGVAASAVAGEFRKGLNEFISIFLGDVFAYINQRFDKDKVHPGKIQQRFIEKLAVAQESSVQQGNEPIVVLSHSMGGQVVYDAITHFLPRDPRFKNMRIALWCATASQVGFFEEAKLFIESNDAYKPGNPVPFPSSHLKAWWNVWDHNDFLSFTAKNIIAGIDDGHFSTGMSLIGAHSGYLQRPSFYRLLGEKVKLAIK
ncbi:MAG: hypothetical protein A2580_04395 [Hydrogenophilales bacterium RIFOXYD1_FULL_62_11]|nr:MAG: hypothetical protein A2580_04395 [Hydrogenophilales bacterium RIFOXYD1_FULL_62_11]